MDSSLVTTILAAVLAAGFGSLAVGKLLGTSMMRDRAEGLGFTARAYQLIGALELAGAAGLLVGLLYAPLGYAAGTGLALLVAGAAIAHLRAHDGVTGAVPAIVFLLATIAYLIALGATR